MANVEQRAEGEAEKKGLSGQARKSYVGGVFNRIRQAHERATTPGARGRKLFNRRERVQARLDARLAMQPHREAIDVLRRQRNERIAAHQDEPKSAPQASIEQLQQRYGVSATPAAKPPRLPAPERQRQRAIADAIKHGAPDFPPGTLAAAQGKPAAKSVPKIPKFDRKPLVPIKEKPIGFQLDATRQLDPYFIQEYFGDKQLPKALGIQPANNLAEAVSVVERKTGKRYQGARTNRAAMYHWILSNM